MGDLSHNKAGIMTNKQRLDRIRRKFDEMRNKGLEMLANDESVSHKEFDAKFELSELLGEFLNRITEELQDEYTDLHLRQIESRLGIQPWEE